MPVSFSVEPRERRVYTVVTGPLFDADLIRNLSEVLEHPAYRPGFSTLVICRDVELGSFSNQALRRFVEFTRRAQDQLKGSRVAVVAPQPAVYGIGRMFQLLRNPSNPFAVFHERAEAEAWLAAGNV